MSASDHNGSGEGHTFTWIEDAGLRRNSRRFDAVRRRLVRLLSDKSTGHGASAFDSSMPLESILLLAASLAAKVARGSIYRPLLAESHLLLVGRGVAIRHPRYIRCRGSLVVEDYAEIQGLSTGGIEFGQRVTIGRCASIRPSGYYGRGLGAGLRVGDRSSIGPACFIGCAGPIEIGDRVMMGQNVHLLAEGHVIDAVDRPMQEQGVQRRGIVIGDDCWLGTGSTVLDGVTIGAGSVVGAGAVVTRSLPPGSIVGGVPARVLRNRLGAPQPIELVT